MSGSLKKHLTAATASQVYEKINRYTFLDRNSALLDGTKRGKSVKEIEFPEENVGLFGIRFSPDATKIIASYGTGAIQIMDVEMCTPMFHVRKDTSPAYPIMSIRCVGGTSDIFYAAGICGNVYLCRIKENSSTIFAQEKSNEINAMDFDSSLHMLATGGKDGAIRLYDTKTGVLISKLFKSNRSDQSINPSFHTRRIFSIKFHSDRQNTFLSGGWDDCVKIWDTRNKEGCVRNINGPHICGDALDVNENVILTGQWTAENALQLWDFGSGKCINNIVPVNRIQALDGEFLYCCQYFRCEGYPDTVVAGGSGTGYLEVVNVRDERIVCTFKVNKLIQALDTTTNSKIAYGGMENIVRIATMTMPEKTSKSEAL